MTIGMYSLTVSCPRCKRTQGHQCVHLTTGTLKAAHPERIALARSLAIEDVMGCPLWKTRKPRKRLGMTGSEKKQYSQKRQELIAAFAGVNPAWLRPGFVAQLSKVADDSARRLLLGKSERVLAGRCEA